MQVPLLRLCRKWLETLQVSPRQSGQVLCLACSVQRCEMPVMHAQNAVNGMLQEFSVRFASPAMLLLVAQMHSAKGVQPALHLSAAHLHAFEAATKLLCIKASSSQPFFAMQGRLTRCTQRCQDLVQVGSGHHLCFGIQCL